MVTLIQDLQLDQPQNTFAACAFMPVPLCQAGLANSTACIGTVTNGFLNISLQAESILANAPDVCLITQLSSDASGSANRKSSMHATCAWYFQSKGLHAKMPYVSQDEASAGTTGVDVDVCIRNE